MDPGGRGVRARVVGVLMSHESLLSLLQEAGQDYAIWFSAHLFVLISLAHFIQTYTYIHTPCFYAYTRTLKNDLDWLAIQRCDLQVLVRIAII